MAHNFTGTVGQDIGIAQTHFIANGVDTGKTVSPNNTTFTFPISGIFGFQNTWTNGDTIDMTKKNGVVGHGNSINATFDFSTDLFTTTIGVQNITVSVLPFLFSTTPSTVFLEGGMTTDRLGNVVPNFEGLTNFTMKNSSAGSEVFLGTATNPLEIPTLPTINVINVPGSSPFTLPGVQPSGISVIQDTALFTATTAVNVNVTNAGSPATVSASFSDDYIHGVAETFFVNVGDPFGTTGPATWNIHSSGNNFLFLSEGGPAFGVAGPSTAATTINVTGSGHITLFGFDTQFADVTKISSTATITVTGALQEDSFFNDESGLLAENTVITSISGGAGSFFDLSSLDATQAMAMTTINGGGGGTAVFSNEALTGLSSALALSGVSIVGDGGDFGLGNAPAGTIDFSFLPGANELKFYHGLTFTGTGLVLNNTPGTFTVDFQDENFHDNAVTITPATAATSNTLTLDLGSTITKDITTGVDGAFTISNYDAININVREGAFGTFTLGFPDVTSGNPQVFATDGFLATPVSGGGITLTIQGTGDLAFGFFPVDQSGGPTGQNIGEASISIFGGAIVDNDKGIVAIGITDASSINASGGGGLDMQDPGSWLGNFSVTGSSGSTVHNLLQGTVGPLNPTTQNDYGGFVQTSFSPLTTIVGGHDAGDAIFTTGGLTNVTLHNSGGDTVNIAQWTDDSFLQTQTPPDGGAGPIFGNSGDVIALTDDAGTFTPGAKIVTINNFSVSGDFFTINANSWGFGDTGAGGGTYEGLVNGDLTELAAVADDTFANLFLANSSGATINGDTNLVVYTEGSFSGSLAQLVNALHTSGGAIHFAANTTAGDTYDMLFAYNTGSATDIAVIQFDGDGTNSTQGMTVESSHNLVALTGVTAGGLFAEYLAHHANLFFTT